MSLTKHNKRIGFGYLFGAMMCIAIQAYYRTVGAQHLLIDGGIFWTMMLLFAIGCAVAATLYFYKKEEQKQKLDKNISIGPYR
jgi:hypothetical protein